MPRHLAALLLVVAAVTVGAARAAELQVSARVVRSVTVAMDGQDPAAAVAVTTVGGQAWSVSLAEVTAGGYVGVTRSDTDPSYLVVTIHADAPPPTRE